MTQLSVNLNKIALLRNARGKDYPNVIDMARRCLKEGAHGVTIHPRPDQRHARYSDATELKAFLNEEFKDRELNIEGNPVPEFMKIVKEVKPHQCTLVPDAAGQITSDHGWDTQVHETLLKSIIRQLHDWGVRVSVFLDPDLDMIEPAKAAGADRIELYTEEYAATYDAPWSEKILSKYAKAAIKAQQTGLGVNAGHDLNLKNLAKFLTIPDILEVSIGHALTVEALDHGWGTVIGKYLYIVSK